MIRLTGSTLVDGDILGLPTRIIHIGGRLVTMDQAGEPFIHVIDPANGTFVRSVGRRGEGPGEFSSIRAIIERPGDSAHAWAFDIQAMRLTRLNISESDGHAGGVAPQIINIGPTPVTDPVWLTPSQLIGAGLLRDGTFVEMDHEGRTGRVVGPPPAGPTDVPPEMRMAIYQGVFVARPDRTLLAKAYLNAGRIDIFHAAGALRASARVPTPFEPVFGPAQPGGRPEWSIRENRRGYVDIAASDEFIFGVFSGVSYAEEPPTRIAGRRVDVFDWSGNYRASFDFDVPELVAIAVTKQADRLWLVVHEPVPAVRVYAIPET